MEFSGTILSAPICSGNCEPVTAAFNEMVKGESPAMHSLLQTIGRAANSSASVMVSGESGSGKEVVARLLHQLGLRRTHPFVPVNCTAIPENLLESELFGHLRGSFTGAYYNKKGLFEEAQGGTLFLDEIGDLDPMLQAKLLRVLQDKQIRAVGGQHLKAIDVRIIAATHRNLKAMVERGQFREDLYYRLNVIPLRVPPLRERKEDIPALVNHFLQRFEKQGKVARRQISEEALGRLKSHNWPGNIRELENVLERSLVMGENPITAEDIVLDSQMIHRGPQEATGLPEDRPTLGALEERYIRKILLEENHKIDRAARALGISRRTLYRKVKSFGL